MMSLTPNFVIRLRAGLTGARQGYADAKANHHTPAKYGVAFTNEPDPIMSVEKFVAGEALNRRDFANLIALDIL